MQTLRPIESFATKDVFLYVERSKDTGKLFTSLALASGQFEEPKKNRKGQYGMYADLASLRRATKSGLCANGLAIIQTFHLQGDEMVLNTTLCHSTGEYISSQVPIKQSVNPQQTTAYATYMRRMAYSAILSISAEDEDDGEGAAEASVSAESDGWEAMFAKAKKRIETAESIEDVESVMDKVVKASAERRMAPDAPLRMQSIVNTRKIELRKRDGGEAAGGVKK